MATSIPKENLSFQTGTMATIEVDQDSLDYGYYRYLKQAAEALLATGYSGVLTVYSYCTESINFHEPTWSAFIGVKGNGKLLELLLEELNNVPGSRAKFSDSIRSDMTQPEMHIEDGHLWIPDELNTWISIGEVPDKDLDDVDILLEDELFGDGRDQEVQVDKRDETGVSSTTVGRVRAARSNARVDTIRSTIEELFGLPEGSVALCGPDGRPLRGDAKIATLRDRWA